jgi:hypothetical protein
VWRGRAPPREGRRTSAALRDFTPSRTRPSSAVIPCALPPRRSRNQVPPPGPIEPCARLNRPCHLDLHGRSTLFSWLISHQSAVVFSQHKPATSNQPIVLFSQNKPAPAISHQPNEQAEAPPSYREGYAPRSSGKLGSRATVCSRTKSATTRRCCSPASLSTSAPTMRPLAFSSGRGAVTTAFSMFKVMNCDLVMFHLRFCDVAIVYYVSIMNLRCFAINFACSNCYYVKLQM